MNKFLPVNKREMEDLGWEAPDFVLVTGDPYIDHPSFGTAIISRLLEKHGYKVAVLSQPDWKDASIFKEFGRPRLGFLVTSGSVDSMVANYTANKKRRRKDSLAPGGHPGNRPDRATVVYSNRCKEAYKDCPIIIGGLEASLRRFAHYDYWDNKVRRSILLDSKADILVFGMGEMAIVEIAAALNDGFEARDILWIAGTAIRGKGKLPENAIELPSFNELVPRECAANAATYSNPLDAYAKSYIMKYENNEHVSSQILIERYDGENFIQQNIPSPPLSQNELDEIYNLPFTYEPHPRYFGEGNEIPAWEEMRFSITHVRGCYGNCAFCAITHHQGRIPTSRSIASVVKEAKTLASKRDFKGYIHDVGGPTANIRGPACKKQKTSGTCKNKSCLYPEVCKNLESDHGEYIELLSKVAEIPNVKKVFIRSGLRYDLIIADKKNGIRFTNRVADKHVSGILKVAPEHVSSEVLDCMMKPDIEVYDEFCKIFLAADEASRKKNNKGDAKPQNPQYILPYFIVSHPGCTLENTLELTQYIESHGGFVPDQIQDFYPTPGTLATCMYYTGTNPFTGESVYIPGKNRKIPDERRLQRALLHHKKPENKRDAEKARAIIKEGRDNISRGE